MTNIYRTVYGLVGAFNNNDFYTFTVAGTDTVDLDLSSYDGTATLRVYDAAGRALYSDYSSNSGSSTRDANLVAVLSSGRYYAEVSSSSDSHYSLSFATGTPAVGNGSTDSGGNTLALASQLGQLTATPLVFADYLGASDHYDYYAFNVSSVASVSFNVTGVSDTVSVYLLNAAGQQIVSFNANKTSNLVTSYILPPLSVGTYYVELYDSNSVSGSGYNLSLAATTIPDLAGNTIATARSIGPLSMAPIILTDNVSPSDTADFYSFQVTSLSTISLLLSGVTNNATLSLFDSAGHSIGYSYTASPSSDGSLLASLLPLQIGTYYAEVLISYQQTNYALSLSAQPIPDAVGLTTATATPLLPTFTPATITDAIGDQHPLDAYSITLTAAATLNLRLTASTTENPAYATVQLLNSGGSALVSSSATQSTDGLITINLAPGTYYVDVLELYGYSTPYKLTYSLGVPAVGNSSLDGAGNTLAAARNIGALSAATVAFADWVGAADPADYYQFTVPTVEAVAFEETGAVTGVTLTLQDVSGRALASASGYQTQDTSIVSELAPGTYFLAVTGNNDTGYNLTATGTPIVDVAGNSIAAADQLGTLGVATRIISDFVGPIDPADYYQFTLATAATVKGVITGLTTSATLYLLDIAGNQITNDGGTSASNGSLYRTLAAGTYFFEVAASSTNDYTLSISQTPVADLAGPTLGSAVGIGVLNNNLRSDLTGDSRSDLLVQNDNGAIVVLTQANLGITSGISLGNPGASWHVMGNADFNGDGQDDIVLQNTNGTVVDYLMIGTTVVSALALGNAGPSWHVRGAADYNADGKADILLQNDDRSMVVWYTNGTAVTAAAYLGNPGPGWTVQGVGDFNGDGQTDILVQNTTGAIVDYCLNGGAITYSGYLGNPGPGWAIAGTGDYNADGQTDIFLHNDNGQNVIWNTNGSSILSATDLGTPGASWTGVVAGVDLNGDGSSDLVLQNTDSTLVGFTFNNSGSVIAGNLLGTPGAGWHALGNVPMEFIDGTGVNPNLTATIGADQFDLTSYATGLHQIFGFDAATDSVALSRSSFPNFAAVQAAELPYNGGTYVQFTPGSALVIQGVTPGQLGPSNFVLR